MHFVALDVVSESAEDLQAMLTAWTRAAERMTYGAEAAPGGAVGLGPYGVPTDTGEALDLPPANLTITIGYGPSLFERFGLDGRKPEALHDLPAFMGDDLDPATSGGDICIQACADDPQVAVHAMRNLIRLGFGVVAVRWSQLGFGRTSSTSVAQKTPRNLFGFKDGTNNVKAEDAEALAQHVWVAPEDVPGPARRGWPAGPISSPGESGCTSRSGTGRICKSSKMFSAAASSRGSHWGLRRSSTRSTSPRPGLDGLPAIPLTSHVRLAHADNLNGVRILRRGYNFTDGSDGQGHLNAGLFFIAFMRDAHTQFVPMQRALAAKDGLNEYIEHTGSALFACPPGLADGADWGTQLFG
jgi:deferrochelatase/peroxidase EfeB